MKCDLLSLVECDHYQVRHDDTKTIWRTDHGLCPHSMMQGDILLYIILSSESSIIIHDVNQHCMTSNQVMFFRAFTKMAKIISFSLVFLALQDHFKPALFKMGNLAMPPFRLEHVGCPEVTTPFGESDREPQALMDVALHGVLISSGYWKRSKLEAQPMNQPLSACPKLCWTQWRSGRSGYEKTWKNTLPQWSDLYRTYRHFLGPLYPLLTTVDLGTKQWSVMPQNHLTTMVAPSSGTGERGIHWPNLSSTGRLVEGWTSFGTSFVISLNHITCYMFLPVDVQMQSNWCFRRHGRAGQRLRSNCLDRSPPAPWRSHGWFLDCCGPKAEGKPSEDAWFGCEVLYWKPSVSSDVLHFFWIDLDSVWNEWCFDEKFMWHLFWDNTGVFLALRICLVSTHLQRNPEDLAQDHFLSYWYMKSMDISSWNSAWKLRPKVTLIILGVWWFC